MKIKRIVFFTLASLTLTQIAGSMELEERGKRKFPEIEESVTEQAVKKIKAIESEKPITLDCTLRVVEVKIHNRIRTRLQFTESCPREQQEIVSYVLKQLHMYVLNGDLNEIKQFLSLLGQTQKSFINLPAPSDLGLFRGESPLKTALKQALASYRLQNEDKYNTYISIMQELIDRGADINLTDKFSDSEPLLIIAIEDRNWKLTKFLLENGADPDIKFIDDLINYKIQETKQLFQKKSQKKIMEALLKNIEEIEKLIHECRVRKEEQARKEKLEQEYATLEKERKAIEAERIIKRQQQQHEPQIFEPEFLKSIGREAE